MPGMFGRQLLAGDEIVANRFVVAKELVVVYIQFEIRQICGSVGPLVVVKPASAKIACCTRNG